MSDVPQQPQMPPYGGFESPQDARAHVAAEKAYKKASRPWYQKKRFIIPLALVALSFIAPALGGGGSDTPAASPASVASVVSQPPAENEEQPSAPAQQKTTEQAPPPASEPEAPALTVSQKQAVKKATQYLAYTAFSRSGLIEQLEYEGFSNDDARFAVDNIEVDWMEQAAKKAEDYLNYSSFSRASLIDQLEFEGFTREQAEHGADAVGL